MDVTQTSMSLFSALSEIAAKCKIHNLENENESISEILTIAEAAINKALQ